jgi:hypothetical protein
MQLMNLPIIFWRFSTNALTKTISFLKNVLHESAKKIDIEICLLISCGKHLTDYEI